MIVIGQGYVGLPLARTAALAGLSVVGFDSALERVRALNSSQSPVDDVTSADLEEMIERGYRASHEPEDIASADVVVICVPTPLGDDGSPDTSAIESAGRTIARHMVSGTLVVLESTTYPGTTEDILLPILQSGGLLVDHDFFLAYSPERVDPGNPTWSIGNTPKVVGGTSAKSRDQAVDFYSRFVDEVVAVSGTREAEMSKLLENTYRHVNIALVNEMVHFCHELGIDLWEVVRAASTKPFGFQAFYPGPGVGGHCIPIDPNYLSFEVRRQLGYPFRFVELAQEINTSMPSYVVERIQDLLNDRERSLRGADVLLLGVTYKENVSDRRESQATPIAKRLIAKGARLAFHDPRVREWAAAGVSVPRVDDLEAAAARADIVVLLQAHREYDAEAIAAASRIFFDTRGVTTSANAVRL